MIWDPPPNGLHERSICYNSIKIVQQTENSKTQSAGREVGFRGMRPSVVTPRPIRADFDAGTLLRLCVGFRRGKKASNADAT